MELRKKLKHMEMKRDIFDTADAVWFTNDKD